MVFGNKSNKQALQEWEEYLQSIRNSTPVDANETPEEKSARIKRLEKPGNEEDWFAYYFPSYCFAKPAPFQVKSTKRIMKAQRMYQRRAWARGLAKSTRRMMEVFYLTFVKKHPTNALLISKTEGNAARLLAPYRANLEGNQRLINDYGVQEGFGAWREEEFVTRGKHSFRAVGAEQNPRGAKMEEVRVNMIIFDDIDDDEVCRNSERVANRWKWIEKAVIPTIEISKNWYIFFDNNIIAEDSLTMRAAEFATDDEVIPIRDEFGRSVWPEKNSEQDIDDALSKISYESQQGEYFNNPMGEGKAFKEIIYGKCPPLKQLSFIIIYSDPSTSNRDKPVRASNSRTSCKAVWAVGYLDGKYYVYRGYVDTTSNSTFVDWMYELWKWSRDKTQPYTYIENNTLQNPFYEQVLLPLIAEKAAANGGQLPVTPDTRDKPDKWFRIEGNLEPLNRLGNLIFNIDEKDNPHMKRLEAQFKSASANSRTMDGPDAIEGAVHIIKQKTMVASAGGIQTFARPHNKKRF